MNDKITQIVENAAGKTMGMLNEVSMGQSQTEEKTSAVFNDTRKSVYDRDNKEDILTTKKNIMARIIEKVTLNDVRECLDEMNFNSKYLREEQLVVSWYSADEDFGYDVMFLFRIEGENNDWIKIKARAPKQFIPTDDGGNELMNAYLNVNRYNRDRRYARAYVERDSEDDKFFYVFEENLVGDQPLTFEYLLENIKLFCPSAWHFFCNFTKSIQEQQ